MLLIAKSCKTTKAKASVLVNKFYYIAARLRFVKTIKSSCKDFKLIRLIASILIRVAIRLHTLRLCTVPDTLS